jgi:hypothetical protein
VLHYSDLRIDLIVVIQTLAAQLGLTVLDQDIASVSDAKLDSIIYDSVLAEDGNVTISDIPQRYRELEISIMGRSTAGLGTSASVICTLNGDSSAIYDYEIFRANAASPTAEEWFAQTGFFAGSIPAAAGVADTPGFCKIIVYDYAQTRWHKMMLSSWGNKSSNASTGMTVGMASAWYRSLNAIPV